MNFKKTTPFLLFIIFIVFITVIIFITSCFARNGYIQVLVANQPLWVKLAKTEEERIRGLSGVKSLAENEGRLFILPQKQQPIFWMKDMNFPLDFIWIEAGKVVDLTENAPAPSPDTPDWQLIRYQPKQPVDMVLEVNSGWAKKSNLKIGASFSLNY